MENSNNDIPVIVEIKKVARIKNLILEIPRGLIKKHENDLTTGTEVFVNANITENKIELIYTIDKVQQSKNNSGKK